jgi:NtrC-family two-component system sensor histidine kinase KinB
MGLHALASEAAGELNDKQKEIIYDLRQESERLERLMRDLTDLSRIESGQAVPHFARIQIGELIDSVIQEYRLKARAKDQEITTNIASDLPPLRIDAGQIRQVLDNLLSNAVRNAPRGGSIQIDAARREDYVAISVADTGRGIPPEYLSRLFTRFLSIPETQSGGTGLGLAISRRLIEAHGGQMSVRSEVGRGTTVTFTLPIRE